MWYRALPHSSQAKTLLISLIGEGSVCGATLCREAESSIVSIAAGVNGNDRISLMTLRIRA